MLVFLFIAKPNTQAIITARRMIPPTVPRLILPEKSILVSIPTTASIAKIIPTYYFVKSNEIIKTLEEINFTTLTPVFINMVVLVGFSILFIILTNVVTNKRRKIG